MKSVKNLLAVVCFAFAANFVNAQNEVIVVSTNNKDLDAIVKSTLNYKKIAVNELEYNKVYTVPVVIK